MNPQMGPQMNIEMSAGGLALAGSLTYRAAGTT
jgi:hypothetical protein